MGRIEAIVESKGIRPILSHGALLTYFTQSTTTTKLYVLREVETIFIPFELAREDIYFLHHMLELCYFFLPLHAPAPTIFELLTTMFANPFGNKPIMLMRFFAFVGIYPEDLPFEESYFLHLLSCPFETILKEKLDAVKLKMLQSWLLRCLAMHPYENQFKTYYRIR